MEKEEDIIQSSSNSNTDLKRTLSFPVILLITVNSIIGTGIYFLPALGAKIAGPASIISWIILSIISIYIGMCFGELASMFPKSGGVYEYTKQGFGRGISFFVGWTTIITSNITIAMLIVGGMQYLLPEESATKKIIFALFCIALFHYIAYRGMNLSARILTVFAIATLSVFVSLIIFGIPEIKMWNYDPFFAYSKFTILIAIFLIAETFFGWESATFLAEETKDPEKVMPKALIFGTILTAVITLLLVTVSLGVVNFQRFGNSEQPLLVLSGEIFGSIGARIFQLVIGMTILGAAAGWIVSTPRLILALTKDKLFFSKFKSIHKKYKTPHMSILFQYFAVTIMIFLGMGNYHTLLELLVPLVIIVYAFVMLTIVVLRFRQPELHRPYKVPFGKFGPILIIIIFGALLINWTISVSGAWAILRFGLSIISIGIPTYILIEMYYDPKMIQEVGDITARFNLISEKANLPPEIKKDILLFLGDIRGKTIFDYGCGSGSLAISLSKDIGPDGRIYAADFSSHKLKIIKKKIDYAELDDYSGVYGHITLIHDTELLKRIPSSVPKVDFVVSINSFSNIQDLDQVMNDMKKIVKDNGKICFVETVDYFKVLPNAHWLDEKRFSKLFRDNGFSIQIFKRKHLFWNYLYIYGVKNKDEYVFI